MVCKHVNEIEQILNDSSDEILAICDECVCEEEEDCFPEFVGKGTHPDFPDDRPVEEGVKFDHHWYLKENPDVAANVDCFHDKPYAHYVKWGKDEGRLPFPPEECHPEYFDKGTHPDFPNDRPVEEGVKFDHHWYLNTNPDVKINECYGTRPYAHYKASGEAEGRKPFAPAKPKMNRFVPDGGYVKVLDGHDNGITSVSIGGQTCLITGDGFANGHKHETCVFLLAPGLNPMVPSNWKFARGLSGKCYGALYVGSNLYLLQSDKGSTYEGTQNCRIYNFNTGTRSRMTLQDKLNRIGGNWFFVNRGHGFQGPPQYKQVQIGCMNLEKPASWEMKTPVRMYQGYIDDVNSFHPIGICDGLNGPRRRYCTTCSITYVPDRKQYAAVLGDWTTSIIYQFMTKVDNMMGPYSLVRSDQFSPPMVRNSMGGRTSGVFTGNFFELGGQWYRSITGHGGKPDDSAYIQKVKAV